MSQPGFWDSQEKAQETVSQVKRLKNLTSPIFDFKTKLSDLEVMSELIEEVDENEKAEHENELKETVATLLIELDSLEISSFLSGELDRNNAILSIHAGAGGTESCDWAEMLLRMYTRWAERRNFSVVIDDIQTGEEAGISRAVITISGENAYGYARAERGVHRLVRISPFDSNKRRHTSFSAVDVIAEIDDNFDMEIDDADIRIDTYRASGKGGQHVNKTDSAVRMTHIPTGIVVACQNERSQYKNKSTALKILKSRIYEKSMDEKRAAMDKVYGEKNEIGWGNQIRSYVFQPYQMVKDLRTGTETSNVQDVMDGGIDKFINTWLRAGGPSSRNKNIKADD